MSDAKAETPVLHSDGQVHARFLIPLWTWLAILTISIAVFFHAASQGSPILIEFGVTFQGEMKYGRAGLWGMLFLAPCVLALYALTLVWMRRNYLEQPNLSAWERWPAPEFWLLPVSDKVARYLRLGVWVLVLFLPMISLVHLAKKHFQTEFYQSCAQLDDTGLADCKILDANGLLQSSPVIAANKKDAYREFAAQRDSWQRLRAHLSLKHLSAPSYFDHSFYFAKPDADTYFPGLQGWLYLLAIAAAFWLWLRIMLSALFARMVLASPFATLRRLALVRFRTSKDPARATAISLPRPCVRIGVIGHRDLRGQTEFVETQLSAVLETCKRDNYGVRIVSGMAAGTDRLAVDWALNRIHSTTEAPIDLELLVLLPGPSARFRDCGVVDDGAAFNQQLERVQHTGRAKLLELPGVFDRYVESGLAQATLVEQWKKLKAAEELGDATHRALRIAAHRFKTDVLLRQCEFLIAVMKLSDSGKPGGTRECVEEALALNTPVFVIDIDSQQMALVTRVDQLRPGCLPAGATPGDFAACIKQILPDLDSAGIPLRLGYLERIYCPARAPWANQLSPWWGYFESWLANPKGPAASAEILRKHDDAKALANSGAAPAAITTTPQRVSEPAAPTLDFAKLRRRIADDQGAIMSGYRGAFVLAYILGLVAVSLALIIVLQLAFCPPTTKASLALLIALTAVKFGVVLTISKIIHQLGPHSHQAAKPGAQHQAGHASINDIAVALRYVSERLRIMPTMVKLGCARMDLLHQSQRMGDPARVAEDLCRRITLAEVVQQFDPCNKASAAVALLQKEQQGQVDYNVKSFNKWQRVHHRLERIVQFASRALIWIIVADLAVLALKLSEKLKWLPHFEALSAIGLVLVVLTALLPALMATCNALLFQTQCEQRAEREQDLVKTFTQHRTATDVLASQINTGQVGAPVAAAVLVEAERSAAVLAEEVAEWAVMSRQRAKDV